MPWDKVEAAEKGSGAFSLSPIGGRRSRAEVGSQSVMNSLCSFFFVQMPVCSICFSPFIEGCNIDPMFCSMQSSKARLLARTRWIKLLIVMLSKYKSLQKITMTSYFFHIPLPLISSWLSSPGWDPFIFISYLLLSGPLGSIACSSAPAEDFAPASAS